MEGHGEKLSRKQEEAIAALLTHSSVKRAAEAIQVDRHTLGRWMRIPEFNAAFRQASMVVLEDVTLRMQHRAKGAAGVVCKLLKSEDNKLRFDAARFLLDRVLAWREKTILEDELAEAQRRLDEQMRSDEGCGPPE
jgi:hypothetical protein